MWANHAYPLLPLLYDALSAYALWVVSGLLALALTASLPILALTVRV